MKPRRLVGVEADRIRLKSSALRIIREVLTQPLAGKDRGTRKGLLAPPPLSAFKRLEPLGFDLPKDDDWWLFAPEICPPDLVWPLNVGLITNNAMGEGRLCLQTFKTVRPKDVRGAVSRFSPFMLQNNIAEEMDGEMVTARGVSVYIGGQWVDANAHKRYKNGIFESPFVAPERDRMQPALASSLALRQRYEWAVALGLEGSPSVRFTTDPVGVKEIFKIRDLPAGRDRRESLLGWVTDHWRNDRVDPDAEIYVRKHLRGGLKFSWLGMECELLPAPFDVELRDRYTAEREAMRMAGVGRRQKERQESEASPPIGA